MRRIELFTRAGGEPLGEVRAVIDAAFSAAVLEDGENSPLIDAGEGRAVILRVVEHRPARLRPLDEVRAEVETAVRIEEAREPRRRAWRSDPRWRAGRRQLCGAGGGSGRSRGLDGHVMGRTSSEAPPEVLAAIFRAPRPAAGKPVFDGLGLPSGGYAVFGVTK